MAHMSTYNTHADMHFYLRCFAIVYVHTEHRNEWRSFPMAHIWSERNLVTRERRFNVYYWLNRLNALFCSMIFFFLFFFEFFDLPSMYRYIDVTLNTHVAPFIAPKTMLMNLCGSYGKNVRYRRFKQEGFESVSSKRSSMLRRWLLKASCDCHYSNWLWLLTI